MKDLLEELIDVKSKEKALKEEREQLEAQIYLLLKDEMKEDSQTTWNIDNYKLVIKPNFAVSVDQVKAAIVFDKFKVKYEMSYSQYKKAIDVDDIVTIKVNKPTFSVEMIND